MYAAFDALELDIDTTDAVFDANEAAFDENSNWAPGLPPSLFENPDELELLFDNVMPLDDDEKPRALQLNTAA